MHEILNGTVHEFEEQVDALVHTQEFLSLAKYVDALKKKNATYQIERFSKLYKAQMKKVIELHNNLTSNETSKMNLTINGAKPNRNLYIDVDNDAWYEFNA